MSTLTILQFGMMVGLVRDVIDLKELRIAKECLIPRKVVFAMIKTSPAKDDNSGCRSHSARLRPQWTATPTAKRSRASSSAGMRTARSTIVTFTRKNVRISSYQDGAIRTRVENEVLIISISIDTDLLIIRDRVLDRIGQNRSGKRVVKYTPGSPDNGPESITPCKGRVHPVLNKNELLWFNRADLNTHDELCDSLDHFRGMPISAITAFTADLVTCNQERSLIDNTYVPKTHI